MPVLKVFYYGLLVLSLITLLLNYKKLGKSYIWFIPLLSLAIITQASSDIINWELRQGEKKYFIFHFYQPVEYTLLALFYWQLFKASFIKKFILISIPAFIVFCIFYYSSDIKSFLGPDFTNFTLQAILISLFVIYFFVELFKSQENVHLSSYPAFWINTGNLFFYSGCLFVMGIHFYLHNRDSKLAENLLSINHYLNLLLYLSYIIGFSCRK